VAAAISYHGADAVRFALAATTGQATATAAQPKTQPNTQTETQPKTLPETRTVASIQRMLALPLDLSNPFVLLRHAHADAASTLRWAAELGLQPPPRPLPTEAQAPAWPRPSLQPAEISLVSAMSWLPERVAAAYRRRRPAELTSYLILLAGAWLDCAETCPALPFRGGAAPAGLQGAETAVRLELAEAARTALAAGLRVLGLQAPARI
jgi:arginyl-tRNA synthetase